MQKLKMNYLHITKGVFKQIVALEDLEKETDLVKTILDFLNDDRNNRFKIELLMFPSWAGCFKVYKINQNSYTHIRIKSDF